MADENKERYENLANLWGCSVEEAEKLDKAHQAEVAEMTQAAEKAGVQGGEKVMEKKAPASHAGANGGSTDGQNP